MILSRICLEALSSTRYVEKQKHAKNLNVDVDFLPPVRLGAEVVAAEAVGRGQEVQCVEEAGAAELMIMPFPSPGEGGRTNRA